jgi:predicted Zn finger-like uncharacterized protein
MNITCSHCKTKLNIPDNRIPKDKDSSFKCPKCQGRIKVSAMEKTVIQKDAPHKNEPGTFGLNDQALVCMEDSLGKEQLEISLKELGFHVETPGVISEALKQMAYQLYPLVLVDRSFDRSLGFEVMSSHMKELDTSLRRRICFILFSENLPTGDPMSAMHSSVNYIIGSDGLDNSEAVLSTAIEEHRNFYKVYNDSLRAAGKA